MKQYWWKVLCVLLITYTIIAGFLMPSPALPILHESIRNLYFHVPMWFGMTILLLISMIYSIRFLSRNNLVFDIYATAAARIGLLMGVLGILTGMQWARTTWGAWWTNDPKLMGAAVGLLIYLAYFVLRNSIDDIDRRAKVSAVFNIMAYAIFIPAIFIVPRLTDSLHPGNGGNPGFSAYDLDGGMRLVFYPAVLGWSLLGIWIMTLVARIRLMEMSLTAGKEIFNTTATAAEVLDSPGS
ncbi:MAG: cytochrome c biogenesis protein CcsA [Chitinophagales bacterium]|nr:cytochrome c biogenesis protein CcsA [Chitinophagales bacterium]